MKKLIYNLLGITMTITLLAVTVTTGAVAILAIVSGSYVIGFVGLVFFILSVSVIATLFDSFS